jgi:phage terminase large subunit GpA-like protein
MDLYFRDPGVFASEYQNNPLALIDKAPYEINVEDLMRRVVGIPRGCVPNDTDKITAFIDVQRELLYYVIVAWGLRGNGHIVDYGSCPDQKRLHWTKASVAYSLPHVYGDDFETYLRSGLDWLVTAILDNEYRTEDGGYLMVDRLAIDSRWGESTHIIRRFCRESKLRSRLHPSMGLFIGANSKPWQKLSVDKKDRKGVHSKLQTPKEAGRREMLYDTNYWKSWVADRLTCNQNSPKAIVLFDAQPHEHRMFAEHCAWEEPLRTIGKTNNEVVEWKQKSLGGTVENDYWDCLVGNAALASIIGVETHSGNRKSTSARGQMFRAIMQRKDETGFKSR